MNSPDLLEVIDSLGHPRVMVVGDLIYDIYTWGDAERISQEAPVILLRADRRETRLGGAANVCQMLRGLEAEVLGAGVVGSDEAGSAVRAMLEECGVDCAALLTDASRPTTTKERFMGRTEGRHPHQILRVDHEVREPLDAALEAQLVHAIQQRLGGVDIVLVSDYGKGVCSPSLLRAVIDAAKRRGVPVVVDPVKSQDFTVYRGATAITPNRAETEHATGRKIKSPADAFAAAHELCQQADLDMAIITLDRDGMALVRAKGDGECNGGGEVFPTRPRAVYDITGAGDIVLATIGVCLAAGTAPETAVRLANVAGGLEVEQVGVAVIARDEIRAHLQAEIHPAAEKVVTLDNLARRTEACRQRGQRIVFTNGCFDLLHVGHITYLHQAAALGDVLVIGLNSDASVRSLKGPKRPVIVEQDRAAMLSALACVDFVTVFDEATPAAVIERIRPDVLVKGGDYRPEEIVGREFVESYGGQVVIMPLVAGVSTTEIIKSVAA